LAASETVIPLEQEISIKVKAMKAAAKKTFFIETDLIKMK
jgi:hypothetical protein